MVTDLIEIRLLAAAKEAENLRFRRYLHDHHSAGRLFRSAAVEVEKQIDCTSCANCCRETRVHISPAEIEAIARQLAVPPAQVIAQYTEPDGEEGGRMLRQTGNECVFLSGNVCTIYPARPGACRDFPYVTCTACALGSRMSSIFKRARFCPIVYNTIENCKKLVGFPADG